MAATILNYVHAYLPDRAQDSDVIFPKGIEYCCHLGNNGKAHTPAKGAPDKSGQNFQKSEQNRADVSYVGQDHTTKI